MKKLFMFFAAACMLTLCAVSFSSCSEDEDETCIYTVGINDMNFSSGLKTPQCMAQIENGLKAAVKSVAGEEMVYKGNPSDADKRILNACKSKEAEFDALDKSDFSGYFNYRVRRVTASGDVNVYQYKAVGTK